MLVRTISLSFMTCLAIVALSVSTALSQKLSREKQLDELADAERAFAAFTVKEGFRDGFIKFFADDGIGFGPHPERTREKLMKSPSAAGPRKVIFNWAPMFGDISAAGDLGYTTGPVLFTDMTENPRPHWHGMYFSVWQKQADGGWKVVVDMGVDTPQAVAPINTQFRSATVIKRHPSKHNVPNIGASDLSQLDVQFSDKITEKGMAIAYANTLDRTEFRLHRKGHMPVIDENDLVRFLMSGDKFEYIGGKISSSNDLAFTYGKYARANQANEIESGYYVHVWRRDSEDKWRLVVDVQNPLPKSQK